MKVKVGNLCINLFLINLNHRYVTSVYFVTTTASTVGYGEYGAHNSREKVFMIFLEFVGICSFSLITGNMS